MFRDADGDGYGTTADFMLGSGPVAGYVATAGDCDDSLAAVNPGAIEIPDNASDDNCDGVRAITYWRDADGDYVPTSTASTVGDQFGPPLGYAWWNQGYPEDCDDGDANIYPNAYDAPNDGIDQDCDGFDASLWYFDSDGDTYGDGFNVNVSSGPVGNYSASIAGDCADYDADINPGMAEVADNYVDENCDGVIAITYYQDVDGDGYADSSTHTVGDDSGPPVGYTQWSSGDPDDCDDANANVYPGAYDAPLDAVDQDCDGADAQYWYIDRDADGFGDDYWVIESSFAQFPYLVNVGGDCFDYGLSNGVDAYYINPGVAEVSGNMVDDDCDPATLD